MNVSVGDRLIHDEIPRNWYIITNVDDKWIECDLYTENRYISHHRFERPSWVGFTKEHSKSQSFKNLYEKLCG